MNGKSILYSGHTSDPLKSGPSSNRVPSRLPIPSLGSPLPTKRDRSACEERLLDVKLAILGRITMCVRRTASDVLPTCVEVDLWIIDD